MESNAVSIGLEYGYEKGSVQAQNLQYTAPTPQNVAIEEKHAPDPSAVKLFWYMFASSYGGRTRLNIITLLRERPYNRSKLAEALGLDYKSVQHHLDVLEKNNLITRQGEKYGVLFFISPYLEAKTDAFDEVVAKLQKGNGDLQK